MKKTLLMVFCWGMGLTISSSLFADEMEDLKQRIEVLEQKLEKNDERTERRINSLSDDMRAQNSRLRFSGFATVGVTQSSDDFSTADRDFTKKLNYSSDTKAGIQADYQINNQWSATIQLLAKANDEWDTKTEWAFIKYKPDSSLWFRAGRLRIPLYYYSESLDIGFAYPWARPPIPFYVTSLANFEGADAHYIFYTGEVTHEVSLHVGATKGDLPNGLTSKIDDIWGGTYQAYYGNFGLRLMTHSASLSMDFSTHPLLSFLGMLEDSARTYTISLSHMGERLYALIEYSAIESEWTFIREGEQGQATLGYQWNDLMAFTTYSYFQTHNEQAAKYPNIFEPEAQVRNTSLGLRWNLSSNINLKLQYDHFYDLIGTTNFQGMKDGTDVYTININGMF